MSRTEVTTVVAQLTPSKLHQLSGAGDGAVRATSAKGQEQRHQVPSCRRFAARQQRHDDLVKHKLERAIEEQQLRAKGQLTPGPTRRPKLPRRSATMAEITPSARRAAKGFRLAAIEPATSASATDAGRRVYNQLLLNAWRRKREQVSTLADSSRRLQDQVDHLQRQMEVLRDLRKSEGRRRSEAAHESCILRTSLEQEQEKVKQLTEEKRLVEEARSDLERRVEELRTEVQNAKNDAYVVRSELRVSEVQLNKEREKIGRLRKERESLVAKVTDCEKQICEHHEKLKTLQETLHNTENSLQTVLMTCTNTEDAKNDILRQLEEETQLCSSLQLQLAHSNTSIQKLQERISELRDSLLVVEEAGKQTADENAFLRDKVRELQDALCAERRRSWWKNAGELAMAPIVALQNAALVMLPALPGNVAKATSTTDFIGAGE